MTKLYIGNLPYTTSNEDLRAAFAQAGGSLASAEVVMDRDTGRSRGFGFVTFEDDGEAQAAVDMWDGKELDGRQLKVNVARPREDRPRF